ncbi:MAG: ATP-binding protein [Bacteroidia bacterium]|nr:ATP-binding protein [Bacteroidia bacterium]
MTNYFPVGKPVTGKDLIGREKEISTIISLLIQGQSIVLIAPRRFGKTSVILEVLRRLKKIDSYTAYIDLFSAPSLFDFAECITREVLANKKLDFAFNRFLGNIKYLLKNIEFKQEIENYEFIISFADKSVDSIKQLTESINFIEKFSSRNNHKIVVSFDEFGDIIKFDGNKIVKLFRSHIQLQKHTSYIFSGSYETVMNQLFVTSKSPFYRFARIINLGFIEREAFSHYIQNRLLEFNNKISTQGLNAILDFTFGHPYYTQLILQQLIIFHNSTKAIEKKDIEEIKLRLLYIELNYLEKTWEEICKNRENIPVILSLAKGENSLYSSINTKNINISRSLKRLIKSGIIAKSGKIYIFNDPLLHYWIIKKILKR